MTKRKKKKDDTEFEIRFYENVLKKTPDFIEALAALGDLYTKVGRYAEGLHIDKQLKALRPADPVILYNLACSYSLLQDMDEAFRSIKRAIECGYDDLTHLERDGDLDNLRGDDRFQRFMTKVKKAKSPKT